MQVGGRRIGSIRDDHAHRRQPRARQGRGPGALRAAARGHAGGDPPDLAVGHRQPLHRADPGAELGQGARRRRDARASARPPTSSTSTRSSTRSTRTRARTCRASSRASPAQYEGTRQGGRRVGRVLQPVPVDLAPARQPADAGRDRADRLHRQLLARRHRGRRAPRRPRRPRRQRERDRRGDRLRERRAVGGARRAADHAAPRQHHVRQPARDARRPRRARRRVEAGDEGARPVPARAAPARPRARGRRSATCARSSPARAPTTTCSTRPASCPSSRRVASPTFSNSRGALQQLAARARVHPPLRRPS